MTTRSVSIAITLCLALSGSLRAQQGDGTNVPISTYVFKPNKVPPTAKRIAQISAPKGFRVAPFATGLKNIRVLAVAPSGDVYVSRRDQGDVLLLRDTNGDGRVDGGFSVVANRPGARGLAIHEGKLYLITAKEVFVSNINPDGTLAGLQLIIGDLPDAGQHANRTIAFGPDGMLYISAGSTCNACNESNPENARLLRASPDGKRRTIYASGLRNTIGFDWNPMKDQLWGMDNGIDFLGDEVQPEELNEIEQGKQYGGPHVCGAGEINPQSTPVGDITKEQWKALSRPMVLGYAAHAAPMQMVFIAAATALSRFRRSTSATRSSRCAARGIERPGRRWLQALQIFSPLPDSSQSASKSQGHNRALVVSMCRRTSRNPIIARAFAPGIRLARGLYTGKRQSDMAAIEAITAVGTRDAISSQTERVRADKLRNDQIEADQAQAKQLEQDKQDERDRIEKAEADKELQRTQAKQQAEKQRTIEQEAQRDAARVQARKQAELERLEQTESNREAQRALQSQSDRVRIEGLNAYRAQTERVQTLSATDARSVQQVQAEPARTLRAQLATVESTRIDKIDLSEIARARLQGAVGLTIIRPTGVSGAQLTA